MAWSDDLFTEEFNGPLRRFMAGGIKMGTPDAYDELAVRSRQRADFHTRIAHWQINSKQARLLFGTPKAKTPALLLGFLGL